MKKLNRNAKKKTRSSLRVETLEQRQLLAGITGGGTEVGSNIVAPNGNVYDQVLMTGSSVSVTADAGQITRVSFLDLSGDIVQAEFSGKGTLTVSLDSFGAAAAPTKYNQPGVQYVSGLASFTISGTDATTNFSVFSVGTGNAHRGAENPIFGDGKLGGNNIADVQRITVVADPANANGSAFGGIRAGNAFFVGDSGVVGISAANVAVQDVVTIGDIYATGTANPSLNFGVNSQFGTVRVAGGDLVNERTINNPGYKYDVVLAAGQTSGGAAIEAANTYGQLSFTQAPASVASATPLSFDLTANADVGSKFTGGAANDTFNATGATLTAGDSLVGGGGVDTLSISYTGANNETLGASVSTASVEALKVTNIGAVNGAGGLTINASLMAGLTDVYAIGGSQPVVINNTDTIPNIHISSNTANVTVAPTAKAVEGTADATTVALSGAAGTLTYNKVETLNVVTSGNATGTTTNRFTISDDALKTMTVSGSAALVASVGFADQAAGGSVSLSAATAGAGIDVVVSSAGNTNDNVGVSITGSGQNDSVSLAAALFKRNTVQSGSAANSVALVTIAGGAGTDTLEITTADLSRTTTAGEAQRAANVTGFENLKTSRSIELDAFPNNSFVSAELTAGGSLTFVPDALNTVSVTGNGTVTFDRKTDTTSNSGLVLTLNGTANLTVATLTADDEETLTISSSGGTAVTGNTITTLALADATGLTITGNKSLTVTNALSSTALATLNAGGHTGAVLSISAANSTAGVTVTGSAGVEGTVGATVNTITTGTGNDSVTGGAYADNITTGLGNDTIVAGGGNDVVNAGLGNDSVMGGAGNDDITGGVGNDYLDGGDGDDTISAGAGLDTVIAGAGTDRVYMDTLSDADSIDGGTGTDTLSLSAVSTTPAASEYVNVTDSVTAQITGVETAYLEVTTTGANTAATAALDLNMTGVSGMTTLWLDLVDNAAGGAANEFVKVTNFSGTTVHLSDTNAVSGLTLDGTGQAALTTNLRELAGGTITYTGVEAVTLNAVSQNATGTGVITASTTGAVTANSVSSVAISTGAGLATAINPAHTVASVTANVASTVAINVRDYSTLNVTNAVSAASGLESGFPQGGLDIDVGINSVLNVDGGTITLKDMSALTVDLLAGAVLSDASGATAVDVVADKTASATINIGAGADLRMDLDLGITSGTATLTSGFGTEAKWTVNTIGKAGQATSLTVTGTGDVDAAANPIVLSGTTVTLNASGLTDADGIQVSAAANVTGSATIRGSSGADVITGSAGADSLTGGNGGDVITGGAGNDTIDVGAGDDTVTGGGGVDSITLGNGTDVVKISAAGANGADRDIITGFTAGAGAGDVLNINSGSFTLTGTDNFAGAASVQAHAAAGNLTVLAATEVVKVTSGTIADATSAASLDGTNLLAAIGGTITGAIAGQNTILIAVGITGGGTAIYLASSTDNAIIASEITLIAVLNGVAVADVDVSDFSTGV